MNLRQIDAAVNGYNELSQDDKNRIAFFRAIWGIQAEAIENCNCTYEVPSDHDLKIACSRQMPVLKMQPVAIDADLLVQDARNIAECITVKEMLNNAAQQLLETIDWEKQLSEMGVELAGKEPFQFLDEFASMLSDGGAEDSAVVTAAQVLSLALRCQLEKPAAAIVKAMKNADLYKDYHPLACPCCGGESTLSHVGGSSYSQGRGRVLVCNQCGTAWEFERIRCARCGQQNQGRLHYYNIEGDDNHRIATCDDCGGYMRTLFSEQMNLLPISYEVEDVVMARLDALAQDPKFHMGK